MIHIIPIAHAGVIADAPPISQLLYNIFTFLLSVFGIIAIIGLVIAGLIYLMSAGNENMLEKAKKAMTYSIIGIVVALAGIIIMKGIAMLLK